MFGFESSIRPILQGRLASIATSPDSQLRTLGDLDVDPALSNILAHLRDIFHQPRFSRLSSTELHDLTCFVMHRLLLLPPPSPANSKRSATSECLRYGLVMYMLIIHGTTYYSHADFANAIMLQLKAHLPALAQINYGHSPLRLWILSIGMAATISTKDQQWFTDQAHMAAMALNLGTWEDVIVQLENILWIRTLSADVGSNLKFC
jgi:hypothetical protein